MLVRFVLTGLFLFGLSPIVAAADDGGTLPVGADGKPLNLDFETGTLKDWTAEGKAFEGQPIKGDTVIARGRGQKSNHQGDYWIGGYEKVGDNETGTLTSAPFKASTRWASFMVAGGHWDQTRVELLTADDNKVFFKVSGEDRETLRPVLVDLSSVAGKEIRIRLVDQKKGAWGHLNFDNFRLYEKKPALKMPAGDGVAKATPAGPADQFKYAGLSADDAAKAFTLPAGFKASVIAAEPEIINPIAFTIDARGRIWVVQSLTYPKKAPEGQGKDSIFIFEDQGDGKRWKKSVFMEGLNLVSGIEVGFGGVWIGAAPELLFIPYKDENGVTTPAGKPQVLLDGWGMQDTHETLNSFTWGPDGWLYGCHGVFTQSYVGKPGTPKEQRVHINAGIWRYHPTKHIFERFAEGTSNPWGLDFDEHGQMFIEACVIPHLWHIIQNARYQRQAGQHDNPYTFDDIKQIADHVHYLGATPHSGNGRSDAAGGGHAHSGMMCYLGDNWPDEYRGKLFMNNIHGARINMDIPEPQGSGFVGRHGKDFLLANDRASQILAMKYGPDGSVYMIDWYDLNQCHSPKPEVHDRTTGRIFRIAYGDVKPVNVDLESVPDHELVELQQHKNEWYPRMARKVLAERAARGTLNLDVTPNALLRDFIESQDETRKLRALWALHVTGAPPSHRVLVGVTKPSPYVAAWTIQLMVENPPKNEVEEEIVGRGITKEYTTPVTRLQLAGSISRLSPTRRWWAAEELLAHSEDAQDHNLPLMYWYALEPLLDVDASRALELATSTKIPNILAFSVRKLATIGGQKELDALVARLGKTESESAKLEILRGMTAGLKGRRGVPAPAGWEDASKKLASSPQGEIASLAKELSVVFGSKTAMAELKAKALDSKIPAPERIAAIESLVTAKDPSLAGALQQLIADPAVRGAALRGLGSFDDPGTPAAILEKYGSFNNAEKKDALLTLASRAAYAKTLLGAVGQKVPTTDFTADVLRQLRNLKNAEVDAQLSKHWAAVRETEKDKLDKIVKLKNLLRETASDGGAGSAVSAFHGRALFAKTCAQCHTLFNEGGKVGPDITGSDRANLDYLLTNVVDPNAVIPADYLAWDCTTTDDRSITGILKKQDDRTVVLQTANELVTLPRAEVKSLKASKLSMMPEGLLDNMAENDIKDLVAYLRSPTQVALLADADSAKTLFNGKDLTGWEAIEEGLYSVENGEIVGRTKTGIKKNQFLTSKLAVKNFRLIAKIKLSPDTANSGIQFRSVRLPNSTEMRGCQADAGAGWWGKLYEESGRGLLFPKKGQEFDGGKFVNKEDWNTYEVLAVGGKIRTAINGHLCSEVDDDQIAKEGIFGLQIHSGGPTEVRFKDFELELDPKFELKTVK